MSTKSKTTSTGSESPGKLSRSNTLSNILFEPVTEASHTVTDTVLHLAGNFEAMKSLCENYGLAAALILTMAFANYSSIDSDAWIHYQQVWITSDECQEFARQSCNSTIKVTHQTRLGGTGVDRTAWTQGKEFYCADVLHELTMKDGGNPFLSFKGTDKECCAASIKCAMVSAWNLEASFIAGNGAGSMLLLMTVLYATLLHIVVQGTKAELNNPVQVKLVQTNLQVPFLFLHILFFIGLGFAFFGIIAVMSIRISTPYFSDAAYGIGLAAAVLASTLILVSFFEVLKVNRKIKNAFSQKITKSTGGGKKPKELAARKEVETIIKSVAQEKFQQDKYEKKLQKAVEEEEAQHKAKAQQGGDDYDA